ncbi:tetratricopeptide repeat protein [Stackebrandtia endophytica]|uniref:Tetratricopeptide repeat protein n=1 Tax=Stackebrandtia endophytica TaxID=1496996 RepID=A0A543AXH7_9ACTN|nr:tetratricopeptide repeat protein [Stackebrandtia endophytica]TQL77276.1 tetratricopeptide repeat protein [Stackebrandtia endophytica]
MRIFDLITYDSELRMIPTDVAAMEAEVKRHSRGDSYQQLRAAGVGSVALGRYDAARDLLNRARELADTQTRVIAVDINLADAHRYDGDLVEAERLCRRALAAARSDSPDLIDFASQHLGKCLTDQGRFDEAREALNEALRLRLAKGEQSLIDSTRSAIDRLEQLDR